MKKILFLITLFSVTTSAQILDPVSWSFSHKKITNNEYELYFKAQIQDGWHLYSQHMPEGADAFPTTFVFEKNDAYELLEGVQEPEPIKDFDPNYDMILPYFEEEVVFIQRIKVMSSDLIDLEGEISFMCCDESQCVFPPEVSFLFQVDGVEEKKNSNDNIVNKEAKSSKSSRWGLFFLSFLSGFAALLTPCVFPMIPMTVSFFTKQSKTKAKGISNAIIYGVSIIIIYVTLGVGVSAIFGADTLNNMATNVYFNIAFFLLLIIFGASFLGAFEIQLPSSWTNKSVEGEGRGGLIGIFFMAFTLALVSFSCTGPIVGTLLVEASTGGGYMGPIIGMFGFSLAIALPFGLFAAFPGWLNSLPQSGGWLNSVKVSLGFLEIALAFKFLSNADLVLQTHLLERELFIAIWIMIFGSWTMYLLGFIRFAHDSEIKYISVTRFSIATIAGVFTIYMLPGLWGAPLKIISGFPPPMYYSESPKEINHINDISHENFEDQHLGPQGIMAFHDYSKGVAYAKKVNKPIFVDFTGQACINCRKMEEYVWSDPIIKDILKNKVVLISLYVDEKIKLPIEEQYETRLAGKKKKVRTTGDRWMVLQANTYGTNSQPYYVFLNHDEEQLLEPANYQDYGTIELFKDWLNRGLEEFNN